LSGYAEMVLVLLVVDALITCPQAMTWVAAQAVPLQARVAAEAVLESPEAIWPLPFLTR